MASPRIAFFTDTFEQINGVALTSREYCRFAQRQELPFLCVRGGAENGLESAGSFTDLCLGRGRLSVPLDRDLFYDPLLWLQASRVRRELERFRPDVIHIVSPGDIGSLGAWLAKKMGVQLAISWHTNLHEFAARRLERVMDGLPAAWVRSAGAGTERGVLAACLAFYRMGRTLFAPNQELCSMLRERTGKPVHLMRRGIETDVFDPGRRTMHDGVLRLGYAGRLTPEKNVRFLHELQQALRARGAPPFRFLIVGDGSEKAWLAANLQDAELTGIRRGTELAAAFANMDVFVFPSRTDTFGNVVLEAFASGVPAVVTSLGGPQSIVRHNQTGFVARNDGDFVARTAQLLTDSALRLRMGQAAREQACGESWDDVFRRVIGAY